jgi:hypothetical protein
MTHAARTFEISRLEQDIATWKRELELAPDEFSRAYVRACLAACVSEKAELVDA